MHPERSQESWSQELFHKVLSKTRAVHDNSARASYEPWFKEAVSEALELASFSEVSKFTGISIRTLENFKTFSASLSITKDHISPLHKVVESNWVAASPAEQKNLEYFVRRVQRITINAYGRDQIIQALIDLGLRYPRGPKIKNEGTHKKAYFDPHALWEGDGKTLKIAINQEQFCYCWYSFIDQNTNLLVGSSLTESESSESFIQSLKDGKEKVGFFAQGVLVDNRLTQDEKTKVKLFCEEHGIVLVNTFPGNSKSNGIIEGNFSIFEKQVGAIQITGKTPSEIAQSIAKNVIEIFTQQRNQRPRKRLNDKTPAEAAAGATRPEHQRSQLERLRDRWLRQELNIEAKIQLLGDLLKNFEPMNEESLQKFRALLKIYSADEIVAAVARFKAQQAKHPENFYRSEYFMAILRFKRDENAMTAYNEAFRAGHQAMNEMAMSDFKTKDLSQLANKIVGFLTVATNRPCMTHLQMSVESLCWGLMDFIALHQLPELWEKVVLAIQRSREISLRKWQIVNEFIHERMGIFFYPSTAPSKFSSTANPVEMQI